MSSKSKGNYPVRTCLRKSGCKNADRCEECVPLHRLWDEKREVEVAQEERVNQT